MSDVLKEGLQDAGTAPTVTDYFGWTRAIGEHYFRPEYDGRRIRIAFDDATLTEIATSKGTVASQFVPAVAEMVKPNYSDAFGAARRPNLTAPHFPFLGLLAAQVLIASRMGLHAGVATTNFWTPFQEAFAGGTTLSQGTREEFPRLWHLARAFYAKLGIGVLAIQEDPANVPYRGRVNINYPLWQVLLREADRAQLRAWLQAHPEATSVTAAELLEILHEHIEGFNGNLRNRIQDAVRDSGFAAAFIPLVEDVRTEIPVRRRANRKQSSGRFRIVGTAKPAISHEASATSHEPLEGMRDTGADHHEPSRLRLRGSPLVCSLQRRDEGRWSDVGEPLDRTGFMFGARDEASGASWRGDGYVAFIDADFDGYTYVRGGVEPDSRLILLFDNESGNPPIETSRWETLPLDSCLAGLIAVRGTVKAEFDDPLLSWFGCRTSSSIAPRLEGGLHLGSSYLSTALPRLRVTTDSIYLNEVPLFADETGLVHLPQLAVGDYLVRSGDRSLRFSVVDPTNLNDSTDGDKIGIALERSSVMCTLRTDALQNVPAATYLLLGAQLRAIKHDRA